MEAIDFKNLHLSGKPNAYLVCPLHYCNVQPNQLAPTYPINATELQAAWERMMSSQPRVRLIESNAFQHQYHYVQYSRIFRFPDDIDVQFIALSDKSSSLAVYSRARLGYYDFHVNENRLKNWLKLLPTYFDMK